MRRAIIAIVRRLVRLGDMIPYEEIRSQLPFRVIRDREKDVFFGYYDVNPFGKDEKIILATKVSRIRRTPSWGDVMQVGYYSLHGRANEFVCIGETNTWCWQMGCRLQWLPDMNDTGVIYNKMIDKNYSSVVQDIVSGSILNTYVRPIYVVDARAVHALSLNFSRLQRMRPGYGYSLLEDPSMADDAPKDDGIWSLELETGKSRLVLSTHDLANIQPHASMKGAVHYVNHLAFNPSGSRFMCVHLWVNDGRRHSRLITSDIMGNDIHVLTSGGMVSHYRWVSDEQLFVYSELKDGSRAFCMCDDKRGNCEEFCRSALRNDGHPTVIDGARKVLLDTYPDYRGRQTLYVYDRDGGKCKTLAVVRCPREYVGELRCDLHPRLSSSGTYICIDTASMAGRAMAILGDDVVMDG